MEEVSSMSSKEKAKGNRIERLVVNQFKDNNIESKRAWGSDGRSLGWHEEVDVVAIIDERHWKFQVKGRKAIADYLKPNLDAVDAQILKEDRQPLLVVLPFDEFVKLVVNE